jgi:hypothetical protein
MDEVLRDIQRWLDEYGLRSSVPFTDLRPRAPIGTWLSLGSQREYMNVVFIERINATALSWGGKSATLLVGPRVTAATAAVLRRQGVNFIDSAGNAFVRFGSVLIDVRGRRAVPGPDPDGAKTANIFSAKRSQVVFALISWPRLQGASVRRIAHVAGVSHGMAAETLQLLARHGYWDEFAQVLVKGTSLVDAWAAAYPAGLGAASHYMRFAGTPWPIVSGAPLAVSGEVAVRDRIAGGNTLVAYYPGDALELARVNRWSTRGDLNIAIGRKFWNEPEPLPGALEERPAPDLLIYADLLASGESRQREVARTFREDSRELRSL